MRAHTNTDVIVIGLGAMGSATCMQLAARGARVVGIDQHWPPHPFGSTHGDTRIIRLAMGEGPEYVPLARRSHELWHHIEQRAGVRLRSRCGVLVLGRPGSRFLERTREAARLHGIDHEDLSSGELRERFPMFAVDSQTEGYYEREAGYARPEAAVRAQLELARRDGAELRLGERVVRWTATRSGVIVRTDGGGHYEAEQLVLCAGAWTPQLFPQGGRVFAVHRQLVYWFAIRERCERLREMPAFIWDLGGTADGFVHLDGFYGVPPVDGPEGGVKVGTESYERTTVPDGRQHPASEREIEETYRRFVRPHLPWLGPQAVRTLSCLYTSTRGSRFVIDRHPDHGRVLIVSACSGHGFKHSPAIGEAVAQLITAGASDIDLGPFALVCVDRPPSVTASLRAPR